MNLLADEIVQRFYTFLWPMLRISAMMMSAPIFSVHAISIRIRILLSLCLTWMVYPLYNWPIIDPTSAPGLLEVFNQVSIGLLMGLSLQIVIGALLVAGMSISNSMGLSIANMLDPNLGNVPVIAQFFVILSTLLFVGLGGHAILIKLVVESFSSMPIGRSVLEVGSWVQLVGWSSMMFLGAVLIALPVMVTLLFINIGLGVATRAAPSLNIFSVGFPAMIAGGFIILLLALPNIAARIQWLWAQGFSQVRLIINAP